MKKIFTFLGVLILTVNVMAQSPDKISYQAIIRDDNGKLLTLAPVGMRISILQGSETGPSVYAETLTPATNANGLLSIEIGGNDATVVSGNLSDVNWANGPYFIKTEADPAGSNNYTIIGTSQILSIPYALHSKSADRITGSLNESDPAFVSHPAYEISGSNITNWNLTYDWGNHAGLYRSKSYVPAWNEVSNKPVNIVVPPTAPAIGDMLYFNGTSWVSIPTGQPGQVLQLNSSNIPNWAGVTFNSVPSIITHNVTDISVNTAICGGNITSDGGNTITSRGVCWSKSITPTINDYKTITGAGAGSFSSTLTGLDEASVYYVRAYATNSLGTGYGMTNSFTTLGEAPTAVTSTAQPKTHSARIYGIVNPNHLSTTVVFEYGTSNSYGQTINAIQNTVTGSTDTYSYAELTSLLPNTIYHFRIRATNSVGTNYGRDTAFTTLGQLPTTETNSATNVLPTSATLKGKVNPNNLSTVISFEYGTSTSYGQTAIAKQSPLTGNTNMPVEADISGLIRGGTVYHYRIKAVNELGTTHGDDMTFTTPKYALGESHFGGIVFYIDASGDHGLVCAPGDQSTGIKWYNGSYVVTNATGTTVGTGNTNTAAIINTQGAGTYAARLCSDLVLNSYSDWFLPSKGELELMYVNLTANGFNVLSNATYWSSTEYDNALGWYFRHAPPHQALAGQNGKHVNYYVRAIRAF